MKKIALALLALGVASFAWAGSKTASGTGVAKLTFPAKGKKSIVKAISGRSDKMDATVDVYAQTGSALKTYGTPANTTVPTNNQSLIFVSANTITTGFTNGDECVYMHDNGVADKRVVSSATSTSVTLSAGISSAGNSGDRLYDLSKQYSLPLVPYLVATAAGTNAVGNVAGDAVFVSPNESPIFLTATGTASVVISATVE